MSGIKISKEKCTTDERFRFFYQIFRITGASIDTERSSILYFIYASIITFCGYAVVLSFIIDTYKNLDDMDHVFENARIVLPASTTLCTHFNFSTRKKAIVRLIQFTERFTWEDCPAKDPDTGYSTMASLIPRIAGPTRKFTILLLVYHATYTVIRLSLRNDRPLSFNGYFPFNVTSSPIYEAANVFQYLGAVLWVATFNGFFGLYAYLVAIACSQLEKLKANLLNIKQSYKTAEHDSGSENANELQGPDIAQQLNDCIRHHQEILKYMAELEAVFNQIFLWIFLLLLGATCSASFSLVLSWGHPLQMSQPFMVYIATMAQIFGYCYFGNELTNQAAYISDTIWESDWIGAPLSYQHSLTIIMARSQKEFTLTAGKFVPVSRETMENIFKQTVSLLMFLMNLKDMNTEDN